MSRIESEEPDRFAAVVERAPGIFKCADLREKWARGELVREVAKVFSESA